MTQEQHPTLTINAGNAGEEQRQANVSAILHRVANLKEVLALKVAWDQAEERLAHVRLRARATADLIAANNTAQAKARVDFSDSLAGYGELPKDASVISALAAFNSELIRAEALFANDRLPRCEVRALLAQSEHMAAFATALSDAASRRMTETMAALAPALLAEGGLTIDPTQTLSGQLQAQARQFLETSQTLRDEAASIMAKFDIKPYESVN